MTKWLRTSIYSGLIMLLLFFVPLTFLPEAFAGQEHYGPVKGRLSSMFGWRNDPINHRRKFHSGIDIAANHGTPVFAPQSGVVVFSGPYGGYGNVVVLSHGNQLYTLYGHNSKILVQPTQQVSQGQIISEVGSTGHSTGPHLHFEVHYQQQYVNPITYLSVLESRRNSLRSASNQSRVSISGQQHQQGHARNRRHSVKLLSGVESETVHF